MWYYALNNQQFGPVADDYLASLIQNKVVNDKTLVWKEGMPNWQPLAQTELAKFLTPAAPAPAEQTAAPVQQPAAPQAAYPIAQQGYPAAGYMPAPVYHSPKAMEIIDITTWYWIILASPFIIAILLWKAWEVLKDGYGRTSPFKALFYTAIPFYNFYWNFTSIHGLAIDMNNYLNRFNIPAPRLDTGIAQFICIAYIGMVVPFLNGLAGIAIIILGIIFMNQLKNTLIAIYDYQAAQQK